MRAGQPLVGLRSNADAAKAGAVLDKVSRPLGQTGAPFTLHHVPAERRLRGRAGPGVRHAARGRAAASAAPAAFKAAVPDASSANVVLFVELARLLERRQPGRRSASRPVDRRQPEGRCPRSA